MPLFNKKKETITYKPITHIAFIMDGNGRWAKKRMMKVSKELKKLCIYV